MFFLLRLKFNYILLMVFLLKERRREGGREGRREREGDSWCMWGGVWEGGGREIKRWRPGDFPSGTTRCSRLILCNVLEPAFYPRSSGSFYWRTKSIRN